MQFAENGREWLMKMDRMTHVYRQFVASVGILFVLGGYSIHAVAQTTQITSSGLNTAISTSGTTTFIDGGTRPGGGSNLFHSFGQFNVGAGDTALFRNTDGGVTSNIFGRVTGGNASNIFGTIDTATNFPQANLWLINPAGFLFGPSATLNVGGSVNMSTADYVKLTDGSKFFADPAKASVFSMEPVASFGFMGANPGGTITIQGGTINNTSTLTVFGRDLVASNGTVTAPGIAVTGGTLANAGGGINLISVKQPVDPVTGGEVGITGTRSTLNLTPQNFQSLGEIRLTGGAILDTSGNASGPITMTGGTVVMNQAELRSYTGSGPGGDIILTGNRLELNNGKIQTRTDALGLPGSIMLQGDSIVVTQGTELSSKSTFFDSTQPRLGVNAGRILLHGLTGVRSAATLVSLDRSTITTTTAGLDSVHTPANIAITARTVYLSNGATIQTEALAPAEAGAITLNLGTLTMTSGSVIRSRTDGAVATIFGNMIRGRTGPIRIEGVEGPGGGASKVTISDSVISTALSGMPLGLGGGEKTADIRIAAREVTLHNSMITGDVQNNQAAATIVFNVEHLTASAGSQITSKANGVRAQAGKVFISGPLVESFELSRTKPGDPATTVVLDHSSIDTGNRIQDTFGPALPPADIFITAHGLILNSATLASNVNRQGSAGNITLNIHQLVATNKSSISSSADREVFFIGDGSDFEASDIQIQGLRGNGSRADVVRVTESSITTELNGVQFITTPAGNIALAAHTITLSNSNIVTRVNNSGPAGNIVFDVDNFSATGSTIRSDASGARVSPGNIFISGPTIDATSLGVRDAATQVTLTNSIFTTAVTATEGPVLSSASRTGGNIEITARGLVLDGSKLLAETKGVTPGGNITLQAGHLLTTGGTQLSTTSTGSTAARAGDITLISASDLLAKQSTITTSAEQASGGNIKLTAPNTIVIANSTLSSSVKGQQGSNGGNISIDPVAVAISNSQILAQANAGAGGNINIVASGAVLVDPNTKLDASAGPAGVSGTVNIASPIQVLSGTLVPLKVVYGQAGLSGDRCAADPQGRFSSFVQSGREGVPQLPGGFSPSPLAPLDQFLSGSLRSESSSLTTARLGVINLGMERAPLLRFHSGCRS